MRKFKFVTGYGIVHYLDGWRGVAILLVLSSHFSNIPGINEGRLGVDLFFSLSGLLMANILFKKKHNWAPSLKEG